MSEQNRKHPWLAVSLSLMLPGLGQIYSRAVVCGIAVMLASAALACGAFHYLYSPGFGLGIFRLYGLLAFAVYLFGLIHAYLAARGRNRLLGLEPGAGKDPWLAVLLSIMLPGLGHLYLKKVVAATLVFAAWLLLNLPIMFISKWSFAVLPAYTLFAVLHAHSCAPGSKARRQGMKLFVITAVVVLTAFTVFVLFASEHAIAVYWEKGRISQVRAG